MDFNPLSSIQAKTLIDLRQAYEAWLTADHDIHHRFSGSMRWREDEYLMRKVGKSEKSLGQRTQETERIYNSFVVGRTAARERLASRKKLLDIQASMARVAGLGRVPNISAKLLRELQRTKILGSIKIIGTNALFAYESLAGVHFSADALATNDIDLLLDARKQLRIIVPESEQRTIIGLLQRLDHSFSILPKKPYCAINDENFMVDLIHPQANPPEKNQPGEERLAPDDLTSSPINGLQWLVNCPAIQTLVIDDRGYPAPIIAPDPRVWMVHKIWLSQRKMRDPEKKGRDAQQANALWRMIDQHLPQFPLDNDFADSLPKPLRKAFDQLGGSSLAKPHQQIP